MMERMLTAWGTRLIDGDTVDLEALHVFGNSVEWELRRVVGEWRRQDRSWREIGEALGVTRQAAEQRFG